MKIAKREQGITVMCWDFLLRRANDLHYAWVAW